MTRGKNNNKRTAMEKNPKLKTFLIHLKIKGSVMILLETFSDNVDTAKAYNGEFTNLFYAWTTQEG